MSTIVLCYYSESALESGAMKVFPRGRCGLMFTRCQGMRDSRSVKDVVTVGTLGIITTRCSVGGTDRHTHKWYW